MWLPVRTILPSDPYLRHVVFLPESGRPHLSPRHIPMAQPYPKDSSTRQTPILSGPQTQIQGHKHMGPVRSPHSPHSAVIEAPEPKAFDMSGSWDLTLKQGLRPSLVGTCWLRLVILVHWFESPRLGLL